jgi:hypothetical protein
MEILTNWIETSSASTNPPSLEQFVWSGSDAILLASLAPLPFIEYDSEDWCSLTAIEIQSSRSPSTPVIVGKFTVLKFLTVSCNEIM